MAKVSIASPRRRETCLIFPQALLKKWARIPAAEFSRTQFVLWGMRGGLYCAPGIQNDTEAKQTVRSEDVVLRALSAKSLLVLVMLFGAPLSADSQTGSTSEEAKAYLDRAIALLQEKHINSGAADWPSLKAHAHAQIDGAKRPSDIYPAIRGILVALKEKHSFLIEPRTSPPAPSLKAAEPPVSAETRPMPRGHVVSERLGYVWLPELNTMGPDGAAAGVVYKQNLISLLKTLDDRASCGWIIDLRDNSGGNMWPMLNGLDPILGEQPFGFFATKGGKAVPWVRTVYGIAPVAANEAGVKPSFDLRHADAPVAVLMGPKTSSTGEMIALSLIGRSKVRTFGALTYGFTTANTVHPLSDGAMLIITETTARDRTGKDYSGAIAPDTVVPVESAQEAASAWIMAQCK